MPKYLFCFVEVFLVGNGAPVIKHDVAFVVDANRIQCFEAVPEELFRPDSFDGP